MHSDVNKDSIREEHQAEGQDKPENHIRAKHESLRPESINISENVQTTDELTPQSESLYFADCGPMKPVNPEEEFVFTTKCETNREKDCLVKTKSADERDKFVEKQQICLQKYPVETESADDHGSNRQNLLGDPESTKKYRGAEDEGMPSSILLLHDTRTRTDEGPSQNFTIGQNRCLPQIMEENKDKHTSQCAFAKDGKKP